MKTLSLRRFGKFYGFALEVFVDVTNLEAADVYQFEEDIYKAIQPWTRIVRENAILIGGMRKKFPEIADRGWDRAWFLFVHFPDEAEGYDGMEAVKDYFRHFKEEVIIVGEEFDQHGESVRRDETVIPGPPEPEYFPEMDIA